MSAALREAVGPATRVGAIGFVELHDRAHMTRMLDRPALEMMFERFNAIVLGVVTARGGEVAEVTSDGASFTCCNAEDALTIGLDLIEAADDDALLPDVRVRISYDAGPSLVLGALNAV